MEVIKEKVKYNDVVSFEDVRASGAHPREVFSSGPPVVEMPLSPPPPPNMG